MADAYQRKTQKIALMDTNNLVGERLLLINRLSGLWPACRCLNLAVIFCLGWVAVPSAHAQSSSTWISTAGGSWSTSGDWQAGVIPGSTSSTTDTDTATFNSSTGTVTVDNNRNLENITFGTGITGAYTLSGGSFLLTSGGTIQTLSGTGEAITINTPITLEGNYTFSNNYTTTTSFMSFGGTITGTALSGTTDTLTLSGTNTNTTSNVISGIIGDGANGGELAITKSGAGTGSFPAPIRLPAR